LGLQKLQNFGECRSLSNLLPIEGARTGPEKMFNEDKESMESNRELSSRDGNCGFSPPSNQQS